MAIDNEKGYEGESSTSYPDLASELMGRVVAIRPRRTETLDTVNGPTEATFAQVLRVEDDGDVTDYGERAIFWRHIRRQLEAAGEAQPWVTGRLGKGDRAYWLNRLSTDEQANVDQALACLAR